MPRSCLSIILAAGDGTRMRSSRSKVLHEVAGLSMIRHVVRAAAKAGSSKVAVVLGRDSDAVEKAVRLDASDAAFAHQRERLGTGHAVLAAREALAEGFDDIVVLFGDTPLIRPETLARARAALIAGADLCVVGFRAVDPAGYGRLLVDANGELTAIREEKDASDVERAIDFCNAGVMAFKGENALPMLEAIGNDNAKGEYYLTDLVAIAREAGRSVKAIEAGAEEVLGVNTRLELAVVEGLWQGRRRQEAMLSGVTLIDPVSTFFAFDTEIAPDVLVEPNVVFAPGVTVDSDAVIHAFSHLEGCRVESGATVGPFARLRPGAHLHPQAKVGNFCEVKNAEIHEGAKVNHLTYIGDASVGARANIGAGTITCNYDGALKHHTEIGADAFVGSNSALVAPVRIGEKAYVASGSVVTEDVPDGALAIARGRQENKDGRGIEIAERNARAKADKAAFRKA